MNRRPEPFFEMQQNCYVLTAHGRRMSVNLFYEVLQTQVTILAVSVFVKEKMGFAESVETHRSLLYLNLNENNNIMSQCLRTHFIFLWLLLSFALVMGV